MSANNNFHRRIKYTCDFNHTPRTEGIGDGYHQHGSPRDMRLYKYCGLCRIARDGMDSSPAQPLYYFPVLLRYNKRRPFFCQRFAYITTDTAIADKHYMAGHVTRRNGGRQFCQGIIRTFQEAGQVGARTDPRLGWLNDLEYQRIKRNRDESAGEDKTLRLDRQEP